MNAQLVNFLNLALCLAWGWGSVCRMSAMHSGSRTPTKILYLTLFVVSIFDGLQFFVFGTLADWMDVSASACICALLSLSVRRNSIGVA